MPAKQIALLEQVAAANQNVVVVLSNGSVVSVAPWAKNAKGILESCLLGQAGGPALADVIFGQVSPSGKLAQSIPLDISDDPSTLNWPGEEGHVDYGEGVFVGYRYYDTYGKVVDYPFGYGLSYATFEIDDVAAAKTGANTATVTATVTNTSDVDAAETVQVYVAPGKADVARPKHELKGFTKVFLKAGESKTVTIDLDERAFAYWSEKYNDWHVEAGEYAIEVGVSSRDIADTVAVALDGDGKTQPLTEWSTYGEWEADPFGAKIVAAVAAAGEAAEEALYTAMKNPNGYVCIVEGAIPTAMDGLIYSGNAQALVNAGSTAHGKLLYSLSKDGAYSETVPTGTDAGEYTVWYKVAGDNNHTDTQPVSVTVTVAPKAVTATVTVSAEPKANAPA